MKRRLKREYFARKAKEINLAREARNTEREFRVSKDFNYGMRDAGGYVTASSFAAHFAEHFKSDPALDVELPPEILNYGVGDFAYLQDAVLDLDESEPSRDEILSYLRTL